MFLQRNGKAKDLSSRLVTSLHGKGRATPEAGMKLELGQASSGHLLTFCRVLWVTVSHFECLPL